MVILLFFKICYINIFREKKEKKFMCNFIKKIKLYFIKNEYKEKEKHYLFLSLAISLIILIRYIV